MDLCSLLGPADTRPLTGTAVGLPQKSLWLCTWHKPNSRDVLAIEITTHVKPLEQLDLMRSLAAARAGATVKEETGIGERAFSVVFSQKGTYQSTGVEIEFVTGTRHVFAKFSSEKEGTEQMRDAVRVIAKKVALAKL